MTRCREEASLRRRWPMLTQPFSEFRGEPLLRASMIIAPACPHMQHEHALCVIFQSCALYRGRTLAEVCLQSCARGLGCGWWARSHWRCVANCHSNMLYAPNCVASYDHDLKFISSERAPNRAGHRQGTGRAPEFHGQQGTGRAPGSETLPQQGTGRAPGLRRPL